MTKSKVMPTAKLIGAPLSRLAFTFIFPINNHACPECYTIGLRVDCLTLIHVRPPSCIGESDQMPTCFQAFAYLYLLPTIFLVGIYKALHIFYKGIAFFCKGVTIKKGM